MNNPATRQQWILEQLTERPDLSYNECWTRYGQEWTNTRSTFSKDWKVAKAEHEQLQAKINAAKEEKAIEMGVAELEDGIETKTQRLIGLQNQKNRCETMLNNGTYRHDGVDLLAAYRYLSAEISKLSGDYPSDKLDITSGGDKINVPPIPNELLPDVEIE